MFINGLVSFFKRNIFKVYWRKQNRHNSTSVCRCFNIDTVSVGIRSYGVLDVHTWGSKDEKLVIGNYVSIASGVKFFLGGEHQTNTITTFPFKVKVLGHDVEAFSKGPIIIEDDVWIGTDVKIMSGVRVGKGAVIAAGSIVTNDVLPYSIVGGVPARFIKSRVPSELIDELATLDIKNIEHLIIDDLDLIYSELDSETLDRINLSLAKINRI